MPKLEEKVLTEVLYVYIRPINLEFLKQNAKKVNAKGKQKYNSYSAYIDELISKQRRRAWKTPRRKPKIVTSPTQET